MAQHKKKQVVLRCQIPPELSPHARDPLVVYKGKILHSEGQNRPAITLVPSYALFILDLVIFYKYCGFHLNLG